MISLTCALHCSSSTEFENIVLLKIFFLCLFLTELGPAVISTPPNITLFLPETPPTITLTCTITDTPLVRITWTTDKGLTLPSLQSPEGFREPSFSQLVLNTSQLVAVNTFVCSAELMGRTTNDTTVVRAFGESHFIF